ncbi:MAG: cell division protein ZipA C-terminal FtsZ-binding domain-containing protein [Methylococcaceae bacterium]
MDRDTVRAVLLIVGLLVIAGVYVWGMYKDKILDFLHRRGEYDDVEFDSDQDEELDIYDEHEYESTPSTQRREPYFPGSGIPDGTQDRWDIQTPRQPDPGPTTTATTQAENQSRTTPLGAPFLIQVSIVGKTDKSFSGSALKAAFYEQGLIHGEMGIYHRMDQTNKEPIFSIASLVEPGAFPNENMEQFESPGIVLFFQPAKVPDPLEVFDNLLDTCHELSTQLDGIEWDETRQPLTLRKIADMRHRLSVAYEPK